MKNQNKFVIARRYKENPKASNIGMIFAIILAVAAFILAIVMLFVDYSDSESTSKFVVIGLFVGIGIFFLAMIPLIKKAKEKAKQVNQYPEEAIFFEDNYFCIQTDTITKIHKDEIKNVTLAHNQETKSYGVFNQTTTKPDGFVTIHTTNKQKYTLRQIKNIDNVKNRIMELKDAPTLSIRDTLFIHNNHSHAYIANLDLNQNKVQFILNNNETTLQETISSTDYMIHHFDEFLADVLNQTAKQLVDLANEWNEDNDELDHPITTDEFVERMKNNLIELTINGSDFSIIFEHDDDMFFGHAIICEGNLRTKQLSATIAG